MAPVLVGVLPFQHDWRAIAVADMHGALCGSALIILSKDDMIQRPGKRKPFPDGVFLNSADCIGHG
jgi:hypothetical protein